MAYLSSPSSRGQQTDGWPHEAWWTTQTNDMSWKDSSLEMESFFVSFRSPLELQEKKDANASPTIGIECEDLSYRDWNFVESSLDNKINIQTDRHLDKADEGPNDIPKNPPLEGSLSRLETASVVPRTRSSISSQKARTSIQNSAHKSFHTTQMDPLIRSQGSHDRDPVLEDDIIRQLKMARLPGSRLGESEAPGTQWQDIQRLRIETWGLRSQLHELRITLKEKLQVKQAADEVLFRWMITQGLRYRDQHSLPSVGQNTLEELMKDCQDARDVYGPLEDDCTKLEDQLSGKEFTLARLEEPFFIQIRHPQAPAMGDQNLTVSSNASQHSHSSSAASYGEEVEESGYHPLVAQYLSKLGDFDLLQERYHEFVYEKECLEEEKLSRYRFGMALDPDDQAELDGAQVEEDTLTHNIRVLEKEIGDLKQQCQSRGLVDEDGEPTSFQSQEAASFRDEEELDPQDRSSEYVKYPQLFACHPSVKREEISKYEPKPDKESDVITTRINEWMLDCLRLSPLDVNLLSRIFEIWVGRIGPGWPFAVLQTWYNDGTIQDSSPYRRVYTSSLMTQAALSNPSGSCSKHNGNKTALQSHTGHSLRFLPSNGSYDTGVTFSKGNSPASPRGDFSWNSE